MPHWKKSERQGETSHLVHGVQRSVALAASLAIIGVAGATSAQAAESVGTVISGNGTNYVNVREHPTTDSQILRTIDSGQAVGLNCYTLGMAIVGPYGTSVIWYSIEGGGWVTDAYLYTGTNDPVTSACRGENSTEAQPAADSDTGLYDAVGAASWAQSNAETLPDRFPADCTWFVSQALWIGGLPQSSEWQESTWNILDVASKADFPGPTKAAVNADYFKNYIVNSGLATIEEITWSDNTAGGARVGDVIAYDWNPPGPDGIVDHLAIVVSLNSEGYPTIAQHSPARADRYWSWDLSEGDWIEFSNQHGENRPRVYLIHITS